MGISIKYNFKWCNLLLSKPIIKSRLYIEIYKQCLAIKTKKNKNFGIFSNRSHTKAIETPKKKRSKDSQKKKTKTKFASENILVFIKLFLYKKKLI